MGRGHGSLRFRIRGIRPAGNREAWARFRQRRSGSEDLQSVGMNIKSASGKYLMPDDAALSPVLKFIAAMGDAARAPGRSEVKLDAARPRDAHYSTSRKTQPGICINTRVALLGVDHRGPRPAAAGESASKSRRRAPWQLGARRRRGGPASGELLPNFAVDTAARASPT